MRDNRIYLKVKVKSLAAEASIIRTEARRTNRVALRNGLTEHCKEVVRKAARNTQLAYGFVRGREYRQIEPGAYSPPDWKEITRMVKQYGICWCDGDKFQEYDAAKKDEEVRLKAWLEQSSQASLEAARATTA
jgi:hypothetical protein